MLMRQIPLKLHFDDIFASFMLSKVLLTFSKTTIRFQLNPSISFEFAVVLKSIASTYAWMECEL